MSLDSSLRRKSKETITKRIILEKYQLSRKIQKRKRRWEREQRQKKEAEKRGISVAQLKAENYSVKIKAEADRFSTPYVSDPRWPSVLF